MEAPRVLPEKSEVHQEIVFTKEYILAMISALGHVMRVPQQNYSCHSRHSRTLCSFTGKVLKFGNCVAWKLRKNVFSKVKVSRRKLPTQEGKKTDVTRSERAN